MPSTLTAAWRWTAPKRRDMRALSNFLSIRAPDRMGFGGKLPRQSPIYKLLALLLASTAALHGEIDWKKVDAETFEHFTKLIRIDTSNPPGNETAAAQYLKNVLERTGFTRQLIGSAIGRLSSSVQ